MERNVECRIVWYVFPMRIEGVVFVVVVMATVMIKFMLIGL